MADLHDSMAIGATIPGHYGVPGTQVTLGSLDYAAAWNLQVSVPAANPVAAVLQHFGVTLPSQPNTMAIGPHWTAVWLGPRSWLLLHAGASPGNFTAARDAINAAGAALFDVSASRVAYTVQGPRAADVLAKSCPLDLHADVFATGQCAQSLLGPINALFCKPDARAGYTVLVARSLADDAWRTLCLSAAQYGYTLT